LLGLLKTEDGDHMTLPLLMAGAFNPIGCLRIQSALQFYENQSGHGFAPEGFDLDDIVNKSEEFLEHLSVHAMLAAGTTGVQGVAPKYLLTQDQTGRWFADMALPDERAATHWLVKLPRGRSDDDRRVLRNEAAYLRVAQAVGLRTHEEPMLRNEMLFVRRFDRVVCATGLQRLHQESVASLAGVRGFGVVMTMNEMLVAIRAHVSDPLGETIEFLKRDALNQALRNTDNHARNTAVQRLPDGRVQLTPVFDFAPMFKDPEIVPRTAHWVRPDGVTRISAWGDVLDMLEQVLPHKDMPIIRKALKDFGSCIERLPVWATECGVEDAVLHECLASIERVSRELSSLTA
jgi:serine/threonine-protein kinase HipA